MKTLVVAVAVALALTPALSVAAKPSMQEVLTLEQARNLVAGCTQYAGEHALAPLSMAVYDAAGNLKFFVRQDGTTLASVEFAHLKGRTAAVTALATSDLAKIEFANKTQPLGIGNVNGLTIVQGGVPVRSASGQHLGGIGVSGAPAEQDEACGLAGVQAMLAPNS